MQSDLIQAVSTVATEVIAAPAVASISVTIKPLDKRCRYWAKVVRAEQRLPAPSLVDGANDVPGNYRRAGDEELFAGDVMIEGEEKHHSKARGWDYWITFMGADGEKVTIQPSSAIKAAMKAAGLAPHLLAGSGDVAACIRIAHGLRAGLVEAIVAAA